MRLNRILIVSFFVTAASALAAGIALTSSPGSGVFGKVTVGKTSDPTTFTVKNSSANTVGITGVSLIGTDPADYTILSTGTCQVGSVLAVNGTCTVIVNFKPTAAGSRTASVRIDSVSY
ncbi:MAG TPA: choice-of-anchor D domain-containing protein [Candidatus Acidoferrales bacterium]|nr:choice-of-anchor D domain-containing protein [Candidatus Acidoferrales bacterium]